MFPKQHLILQNIASIRDLTAKNQLPLAALAAIERDALNFVVKFPLIGAFSSGKSSLLNALLGKPLFAINITAETAVPAELVYASEDDITGHFADGRTVTLTADAVLENHLADLQPGGWIEARVNAPALARLPHLRLVDIPGLDSGIAAHTQAIDDYVPRSLAYGVVVSAEEGNLRESIRDTLIELGVMERPIIAIISKCDKKPAEDVDAIAERVKQEITQTTGRPPLYLVKASVRRKDIAEFTMALEELEKQAETLFGQSVAARFSLELKRLIKHLETLSNRDDLNSEQIEAQIGQLRLDMQAFDARLAAETKTLDAQVGSVLTNISHRVENTLKASLDSLANKAMHHGDLGNDILIMARLAVAEGIREEFAPKLQHYFDRLAEAVPQTLMVDVNLPDREEPTLGPEKTKSTLATIVATLLPVLTHMPLIARVAIPILHALSELFIDHNAKRREEEERKENTRQHILGSVIPDAVFRIAAELRQALCKQVEEAKNTIAESVRDQRQAREFTLHELQTQLACGQAEFAAAREHYLADLATVQNLLAKLEQD
ncbi:MAG: dynamin family protein [Methylococcales bacterium]|nr:dynamin family protein [Methylococcales bacterium]